MTKKTKEPQPTHYLEVNQAIDNRWYWCLCVYRTSRMLTISRGYPSLSKCVKALENLQAKKIIPPFKVKVNTDLKMISEMREDGYRVRKAKPMTYDIH